VSRIFFILATAISGISMPEIASCRGSWGERSYPRSSTALHSVSVNWTHNLPIDRWSLYHWAIVAPSKSSSTMPRCQRMLWCAVGELLRNQR